ncbi:MAG: pectinesterase family protein [Nibricoccus sp.]
MTFVTLMADLLFFRSKRCVCTAFLLCAMIVAGNLGAEDSPKKLRIVLVGDSTVTDGAGWGSGFKLYLKDGVECINTSQGGRSSKSFIDEGRLEKAIGAKGDFYLIQFGHNDQPGKGPTRETDPVTTYPQYMARYIDAVRAIGAQPILVTSLVRRNFDPANPGKIVTTLTPYVEAVKKLGAEKNVPVIELHARSLALCEQLGPKETSKFDPVKDGKADTTHLEARGSAVFAGLIVEDLRKAVPALAVAFKDGPITLPAANVTSVAATKGSVKADAIVSADNSGTHLTVSAAVAAAPENGTKPFVILIKPGVYKEHVHVPKNKPFIKFIGEAGETAATVITNDVNLKSVDAKGNKVQTRDSATVLVQGADFSAEGVTFENTTTREQKVQALAIYVEADRAVFRGCRFLGWQDTVRVEKGRQYFRDSFISGHVDFIYGSGVAVFDRCEIHCRADGYITAASTDEKAPWGYAFFDCRVTAGPAVDKGVYLGRPWRPHAAVAFVRTELPKQIRAEGWHNWDNAENEKTARYREFKNTGPGAKADKRVSWARELTDAEAQQCTPESILRGNDGWNPVTTVSSK